MSIRTNMHLGGLSSAESVVVAAGRDRRPGSPLNIQPVLASNFVLGTDRAYARDDSTRMWEALEEIVGFLEGGESVAFASGMAGIAAVFDQLGVAPRSFDAKSGRHDSPIAQRLSLMPPAARRRFTCCRPRIGYGAFALLAAVGALVAPILLFRICWRDLQMMWRIAAVVLVFGNAAAAETTTAPSPAVPPGRCENADWAAFARYREANSSLKPEASRVVFLGDSITEAWAQEQIFAETPHFVGRGISGQTTQQMLVRFHADVIDLKPALVHIMAGTNDVAGNNGPESDAEIQGAVTSMVELARANHIKVVLASIPPAADFGWHPGLKPIPRIRRLNAWLKSYAGQVGIRYVDYWPALAEEDGSMKSSFSGDGVHPNSEGYKAMQPLASDAIRAAFEMK